MLKYVCIFICIIFVYHAYLYIIHLYIWNFRVVITAFKRSSKNEGLLVLVFVSSSQNSIIMETREGRFVFVALHQNYTVTMLRHSNCLTWDFGYLQATGSATYLYVGTYTLTFDRRTEEIVSKRSWLPRPKFVRKRNRKHRKLAGRLSCRGRRACFNFMQAWTEI